MEETDKRKRNVEKMEVPCLISKARLKRYWSKAGCGFFLLAGFASKHKNLKVQPQEMFLCEKGGPHFVGRVGIQK